MITLENKYQTYIDILKEELVPAMGCTEPIAIAYCGAKLKEVLGNIPERLEIIVSGNILKNVKSVIVPNTNGMHGIETAAIIGIIAGNSTKELEVLTNVTKEDIEKLSYYLKNIDIKLNSIDNEHTLYIEIKGYYQNESAKVVVYDSHTHIALIEKNDIEIYKNEKEIKKNISSLDKSLLNIEDIVKFAEVVNIEDIKGVIDLQIRYNIAISEERLKNNYGANIGKTILKYGKDDIIQYCKALAASGSDARMNGSEMPVVINSGSGNQGITCSVPVIAYAKRMNIDQETLYRALVVSNLVTIHIKNNIGKLSAYCGVVIAGAGCGAGIAFLEGGWLLEISHTIVNALAIISGVVCDGAKSSCAAKIASSVEAGIFGYYMYKEGNEFIGGDGIVKKGVENTIRAVGELARVGMCETDKEIINIMIER